MEQKEVKNVEIPHHPEYVILLEYLKEYKKIKSEGKSKNDSSYVDTKDIGPVKKRQLLHHKENGMAPEQVSEPCQKRKGKALVIASDDDGQNGVQKNHHPEYEVLLKRLKEYKSEGKSKNDSSYMDTKDIGPVKKRRERERELLHHKESGMAPEQVSEPCQKRKGKALVIASDDDGQNGVQKNHHPEYEVLLKRLKEYKKLKSCEGKIKNDSYHAKRKSRSRESRDEIVEVTTDKDGNGVRKSVAFGTSVRFRDVGGNSHSHSHSHSRVTPTDTKAEFRRRALEIISKPFDKIEYVIIQKEFNARSYTDCHPDLGNELVKNRYNRRKRLALLRGFYFWMQNLTRQGAFKPWTDDICLGVEPQPLKPGNNSGK